MATLITINGNSNLLIVGDNISSIQKVNKHSSYSIRVCFTEDIQFLSFVTIEDRDSVFDQIVSLIGSPVVPPEPVVYPPFYIGGYFGDIPPPEPVVYPPFYIGGDYVSE